MLKTLEQLAPEWYEELNESYFINDKTKNPKLDIGDARCCIVGEIHGFSEYYIYKGDNNYCHNCQVLSIKICGELPLNRNNPLIIKLIDHINKHHPELTSKSIN